MSSEGEVFDGSRVGSVLPAEVEGPMAMCAVDEWETCGVNGAMDHMNCMAVAWLNTDDVV